MARKIITVISRPREDLWKAGPPRDEETAFSGEKYTYQYPTGEEAPDNPVLTGWQSNEAPLKYLLNLLKPFSYDNGDRIICLCTDVVTMDTTWTTDQNDVPKDNISVFGYVNYRLKRFCKNNEDNIGTSILDATCAPQQISFPQDINLLNEARENLEHIVDTICYEYNYYTPRMYRQNARKDYLNLAKCKKRTSKKIRKAIKRQLQYVKRDLGFIDMLLAQDDVSLSPKHSKRLEVIRELVAQQQYMYDHKVHSVKDRIVSISQPYIRPIVRGKAKSPTEFGAKLDMSIDERGIVRLERLSFDSYNECDVLIGAIENYHLRNGRYPERVLVDQIYRTRKNRAYCKEHGIRMSDAGSSQGNDCRGKAAVICR